MLVVLAVTLKEQYHVSGGDTINVYVVGSGDGSKTSLYSQAGYGAWKSFWWNVIEKYGSNVMKAGLVVVFI